MTGPDFSSPCIIGYGSMPSRCGPDGFCLWSAMRSPGSRARSVRTCQGLRPRRVGGRLAMTPPAVLPSAVSTAAAPRSRLSRLNGWPMRSPVNASPRPRGSSTHDSGPVWIATPSLQWTFTTYSLPVSRRTETALRASSERVKEFLSRSASRFPGGSRGPPVGCTNPSSAGKSLQLLDAWCQRGDGSRLSPRN